MRYLYLLILFALLTEFHADAVSNMQVKCKAPRCVQERFVNQEDGIGVVARDWGAKMPNKMESPTLLFLPGFPHQQDMWFAQIRSSLGSRYRIITMDWRGMGDSDVVADPSLYTVEMLATDIRNVIEGFNVEGPLILIGHSAGGINVSTYVATFGVDGLAGLVYIGGGYDQPTETPFITEGVFDIILEGIFAGLEGDTETFIQTNIDFLNLSITKPIPKPQFELLLRGDLKTQPISRLSLLLSPAGQTELLAAMQTVDIPVLVMQAEGDQLIDGVGIVQTFLDAFTSTTVEVIIYPEDIGHFMNLENKNEFNRDLKDFVHRSFEGN